LLHLTRSYPLNYRHLEIRRGKKLFVSVQTEPMLGQTKQRTQSIIYGQYI
jgi:hypothetical protein